MKVRKRNRESLKSTAISWLAMVLERPDLECFGGYGYGAYRLGNIGFVNEVGNESTKYANVTAYDLDKLLTVYEKYESWTGDDGDIKEEYTDYGFEEIYDAANIAIIPWD